MAKKDKLDTRIGEFFKPDRPLMSYTAQASGCSSHQDRLLVYASSSALEGSGLLWGAFLRTVKANIEAGQWTPILFTWKRLYDETPMKVRTKSTVTDIAQVLRNDGSAAILPLAMEASTHAKILQSLVSVHILVKDNALVGDHFLHIYGLLPTALQLIERNTGECLKKASTVQMESVLWLIYSLASCFIGLDPKVAQSAETRFQRVTSIN